MSKNRLTLVYSILLLSTLLLPTFAVNQGEPTAITTHSLQGDKQQTYIIPWSVLDAGGKVEEATSANYKLKDAIGQPVIGKCENANYRLYFGFCTIATVVPPVPDPWTEINAELDELTAKVNAATMPRFIKRILVDMLEHAKRLVDNAKIAHEAGNDVAAEKDMGVAKNQVESFEHMVKITRQMKPEDKEIFLRALAKIKEKMDALIESLGKTKSSLYF